MTSYRFKVQHDIIIIIIPCAMLVSEQRMIITEAVIAAGESAAKCTLA